MPRDTAEFISYPVVMKPCPLASSNKTEAGLVRPRIRDDAAALRAFAVLKERAGGDFEGGWWRR
jgi:hypothetical protein